MVSPNSAYKLAGSLMPDSRTARPAKSARPLLAMALLNPKADPIKRSKPQFTCPTACLASTQPPRRSTAHAVNTARIWTTNAGRSQVSVNK